MKKFTLFFAAMLACTMSFAATEITVAQAVEIGNKLNSGDVTTEEYIVTGYVTDIAYSYSSKYGNMSFWMSDTQGNSHDFEAYKVNISEAAKINDKVSVTGKITKYNNTIEISEGNATILAKGVFVPDTITATVAEAAAIALKLSNAPSRDVYTVTGYVTKIIAAVSEKYETPQQSFWMADSNGEEQVLQAYWANVPSSISEFTVGMKITLTGYLERYKKDNSYIPELKYGDAVILETPTSVEDVEIAPAKAVKVVEDGKLIIIRDGVRYNAVGAVIE